MKHHNYDYDEEENAALKKAREEIRVLAFLGCCVLFLAIVLIVLVLWFS